jgi:hypothetical protein
MPFCWWLFTNPIRFPCWLNVITSIFWGVEMTWKQRSFNQFLPSGEWRWWEFCTIVLCCACSWTVVLWWLRQGYYIVDAHAAEVDWLATLSVQLLMPRVGLNGILMWLMSCLPITWLTDDVMRWLSPGQLSSIQVLGWCFLAVWGGGMACWCAGLAPPAAPLHHWWCHDPALTVGEES